MCVCLFIYLPQLSDYLLAYFSTDQSASQFLSRAICFQAFRSVCSHLCTEICLYVCISQQFCIFLISQPVWFPTSVCQFAPRYWNMYIFLSLSAVWHFPNQPVLLCCIRVCLFLCMYRNLSVFLSLWAVWHFSNQAVHLLSCLSVWQHDNSHACLFPFLIKPA